MRVLLQIHLVRFFGVFLLVFWRRGELPYAYAVPVGLGDILMALSALFLIIAPLNKVRWRQLLTIWNVAGSLGLLLSVYIATTAGAAAPFQLRALTRLPLCLSKSRRALTCNPQGLAAYNNFDPLPEATGD